MAALAADRNTPERLDPRLRVFPMGANKTIFAGALVVLHTDGNAEAATTATSKVCVGIATQSKVNGAVAGAESIETKRGLFRFANSAAGDAIARADIGATCYLVDDQTVAKTNGSSTRSAAGIVRDVDAQGVWVEI